MSPCSKKLGFSNEEDCEIWRLKNVAALTSHYLSCAAAQRVGLEIFSFLDMVSPLCSAAPYLPETAGTKDPARRGREAEAQDNDQAIWPYQDLPYHSSVGWAQELASRSSMIRATVSPSVDLKNACDRDTR